MFLLFFSFQVSALIEDLVVTEAWKQKVFPEFINLDLEPSVMFPIYIIVSEKYTFGDYADSSLRNQSPSDCLNYKVNESTVIDVSGINVIL